jgi:diguanylate cyclase (GGDEF)-like protein
MKILLAEDDAVSRLMMKRTLQNFGYEVVLAEDGRRAADILSRDDGPRLALVDWMMPGLDGPGVCREVRSHNSDGAYVYIILLTSRQQSEDIVAGLEAGADDYLTKPCENAELKARLNAGCRILSLEESLVNAREEMRIRAMHDSLTSLWNRHSILARMTAELERAARKHRYCSIIFCDVDHFKAINDTHGHLAGDFVLKEVARRLRITIRAYDDVGRYGGEEFLIVLGDCDRCDLHARCEQIRAAVASSPIEYDGEQFAVSISVGAATCQATRKGLPIEPLLARADAALYRAKDAGRNCVVVTEPYVAS